ncbi:hypothetical protein BGX26_007910 [Mortierella sp. AD094]|nr:hypothetical protein BGX26_007910 [Mortierella sp. AD094]
MTLNEAASSHVLSLIEIVEGIGQFLNAGDLIDTIQVCKIWNAALQPLLYHDINVGEEDDTVDPFERCPPIDLCRANAHRVRSLTVLGLPRFKEYICLRGLVRLERFSWKSTRPLFSLARRIYWSYTIDFLKAHESTIRDIVIGYNNPSGLIRLCKAIAHGSFPRLQSLSISNYDFSFSREEEAQWVWMASRNLVSFEAKECKRLYRQLFYIIRDPNATSKRLQEVLDQEEQQSEYQFPERQASSALWDRYKGDEHVLFPRMKKLNIPFTGSYGDDWFALMEQCPQLEHLDFGTHIRFYALPDLDKRLSSTIWPNLNSMSFSGYISDERIASIFLSMNQQRGNNSQNQSPKRLLTTLEVDCEKFGHMAFNALQSHGHFDTLEVLDLSSKTRGIDILTVLTSCPRLKSIAVPRIHAADIAKSRNRQWVCHGLQRWDVSIEADLNQWTPSTELSQSLDIDPPTECEMQDASLEQLGRFSQLQFLGLAGSRYPEHAKGISLTLDKGLGRLSTLKQLEEISFAGVCPKEEDIKWMAIHWRHLKKLSSGNKTLALSRRTPLTWDKWERATSI